MIRQQFLEHVALVKGEAVDTASCFGIVISTK